MASRNHFDNPPPPPPPKRKKKKKEKHTQKKNPNNPVSLNCWLFIYSTNIWSKIVKNWLWNCDIWVMLTLDNAITLLQLSIWIKLYWLWTYYIYHFVIYNKCIPFCVDYTESTLKNIFVRYGIRSKSLSFFKSWNFCNVMMQTTISRACVVHPRVLHSK